MNPIRELIEADKLKGRPTEMLLIAFLGFGVLCFGLGVITEVAITRPDPGKDVHGVPCTISEECR
jgi:hypothetical protein